PVLNVISYILLARYLPGFNIGILNFTTTQSSPLIYPNPLQPTEQLEYTLTQNETLTLALYDVSGRVVQTFFTNQQRNAGAHKETLSISTLAAGNYFLTLSNGAQKMSVKVLKQ